MDQLVLFLLLRLQTKKTMLFNKLARQMFETNDVDNCSRYCQSPATMDIFEQWEWRRCRHDKSTSQKLDWLSSLELTLLKAHPVLATAPNARISFMIKTNRRRFAQKTKWLNALTFLSVQNKVRTKYG